MNKRYKIICNIELNSIYIDSPVEIIKGYILYDTLKNINVLQLKLCNITKDIISSVYVNVDCFDDAGDPISNVNTVQFCYQDLKILPKGIFGENMAIPLYSKNVRKVNFFFPKVVSINGNVMRSNEYGEKIKIPKRKNINEFEDILINEFNRINTDDNPFNVEFIPQEFPNLGWGCCCGAINKLDSTRCHRCEREKKWQYEIINKNYLQNSYDIYRNIQIKINEEKIKLENVEKQKAKVIKQKEMAKLKKRLIIIIPILIIGIIIIFFGYETNFKFSRKAYESKKVFMAYSVDINKINNIDAKGETYLINSIKNNNIKLFKTLIDNNADINLTDKEGLSPLCYATIYGNKEIAEYLIKNKANNNIVDKEGLSPLCYATKYGRREIAELLINSGANVNLKTLNGFSPMFYAIGKNDLEMIKLLYLKGCDLNKKINSDETFLEYSCSLGDKNIDISKFLIDKGLDINARDSSGNNALLEACNNSSEGQFIKTITLLISSGIDVHAKNNFGKDALSYSADNVYSKEYEQIKQVILQAYVKY